MGSTFSVSRASSSRSLSASSSSSRFWSALVDGEARDRDVGLKGGGTTFAELKYPNLAVNVELFDSGGYEYSDRQISQMENAIQRKVNAIVLTAANAQALIPVAKKALAAGIPVINDDVLIQSDDVTMKISENSVN